MNAILNALRITIFVIVLAATGSPVAAQEAVRSILGVDISGSSTFLHDQHSADTAGGFIENYVAGLDAPHDLYLVSVGDAGLGSRTIDVKAKVTKNRASSARKLAPGFGNYLRSLPDLVKRGDIAAQDTTSLIAFFHSLEPMCEAGGTSVVLFTDGLEWSASVDGRAFVAGTVSLPKPERAFLKGCSITMVGIGNVKSGLNADKLEERLVPQWRQYLTDAGAAPVTVRGGFFSF